MERTRPRLTHATDTSNLADILERVLDKGIVIAGDIKVKLVDIELLTIQVRLMIASVDKAREMGMDWWLKNPDFNSKAISEKASDDVLEFDKLKQRLSALEQKAAVMVAPVVEAR